MIYDRSAWGTAPVDCLSPRLVEMPAALVGLGASCTVRDES